jgi:hypothetical protein
MSVTYFKFFKVAAGVLMSASLALGIVAPASATSKVLLSPYAPFSRAALTDVGATFARPTHAEVTSAHISVSSAYAVALRQVGKLPDGAKVTIRLGLFSDAVQGKNAALSFAVTFDGVDVPRYGPTPGPAGHELVVIVNANTGRMVEAFSYR